MPPVDGMALAKFFGAVPDDQALTQVAGQSSSFSPQGNTGGGLNIPGLLPDGRKAAVRSEATEYARIAQQLNRPQNMELSTLGAMLSPNQAAFVDAIRRNYQDQQMQTGYSVGNQPGQTSYPK